MTKSLPHEHLLAILETQNEIAASSLGLEAVMALVVRRARVLTGGDAAMLELPEGEEMVDLLTGLPDRTAFEHRLGSEVARIRRHGGQLSVCLMDLDAFQEINETLGHAVGDEVLRGVAKRLSRVRGEDTAFRVGGDEFALIFVGTDADGARVAAGRLENNVLADQGCGGVGVSWGMAELAGGDPAELMATAEAELRENK